jgi:linoleoyl-CoA desaturase
MNFNVAKITYSRADSKAEAVFGTIRESVHDHLIHGSTRSKRSVIWIKGIALLALSALLFTMALLSDSAAAIIIFYFLFGWTLLLVGFNLGHDAAHNCLPAGKKINRFVFELIFTLLGANPYLWKIRHIHSHHPYPNVEGCDADIELTRLLRFSEKQCRLRMHRFQHIYAPLLYTIYTLYWIGYKDFVLFFRNKQANILFQSHPRAEWIKLFVYKILYLGIYLGIPFLLHPGLIGNFVVAFFVMHVFNSLFLLFTFLMSHHVPQTHKAENVDQSYIMQQITSSADFHAESSWAYWVFGGFNAHTAHHLFPRISHVHYPVVTRIIRENLKKNELPYNSFSFINGVRYHLIFLKKMGRG